MTRVADSFLYNGEANFVGKVQVISLSMPEARFTRLKFAHRDDGECKHSNCILRGQGVEFRLGQAQMASAFATYFDTNYPKSALSTVLEAAGPGQVCRAFDQNLKSEGLEERAVAKGIVTDLEGNEGRVWFVSGPECDVSRQPNWVFADGRLCKGERGRIGILVTSFKSESEVSAPAREEIEAAKSTLNSMTSGEGLEKSAVFRAAKALVHDGQLKGDDIFRGAVADLLTVASRLGFRRRKARRNLEQQL